MSTCSAFEDLLNEMLFSNEVVNCHIINTSDRLPNPLLNVLFQLQLAFKHPLHCGVHILTRPRRKPTKMSHVKFGRTWYLLSLVICCETFVPQQCTNPQGNYGTVLHPMSCSFCLTSINCKPSFVFSSNLFSLTELFSEVSQCEILDTITSPMSQLTRADGCVGIRVKSTPI